MTRAMPVRFRCAVRHVRPPVSGSSPERALGALRGLALGDALGMPTQSMSRAQIARDYGRVQSLVAAGPGQQIAAGRPAGSVTDDTEQALLLARLLIEGGGKLDPERFAEELLAWEQRMEQQGSADLLGPSTKAALERLRRGVPAAEAGRAGTTNGAAMRIAPVGIAVDASDLGALLDAVTQASRLTHNTSLGLAAAAAVAAAVSVGVGGGGPAEAFELAVRAAAEGAERGHWAAGGSVAARLSWAVEYLSPMGAAERERALTEVVGTSVTAQESVVAALALAVLVEDGWDALCTAANLGGDTDTVAAIAGAVLGATRDAPVWPPAAVQTVTTVNQLELEPIAAALMKLRR